MRWRTLLAVGIGLAAGVLAGAARTTPSIAVLTGWLSGAVVYLVPTWIMFLRDDEATVRRRAGEDDESPVVLMMLMLCAVAASLIAIVAALHEKSRGQGHSVAPVLLCAASLIAGWIVLQSLFTTHYTHRYFGDHDGDGSADKGLDFPGDPPRTYRDFLYVAICIGATCQVSDFDVTHGRFRNLVTIHAGLAFFFNTMVLALGINILGNLVG
jgi:uncharacterized membrane protein